MINMSTIYYHPNAIVNNRNKRKRQLDKPPQQVSSAAASRPLPQTIKHKSHYLPALLLFVVLLLAHPSHYLVQSLQLPSAATTTTIRQNNDDPESRCLSCIRSVTSIGVEPNKRCEGGYYCGPFQFSYQYWAESGKPGNSQGIRDFEKCARDKQCAESTVRAYFKKFKRDCNNDGIIDCLDMAALHKAGPSSCSTDWFYKSRYWSTFNKTTCALNRRDGASSSSSTAELFQDNQQQQRQVIAMKNQTLTTECLDCICEALSSCSGQSATNNCGSGLVCGPFAISQAYWKDGRRPGASWTACARTRECSSVTIRNYMDKYKRDCNGDGLVTCEDYAAIHRRGPMSCTNRDLLKEQYWTRFLTCRANQKPSNDANLVKLVNNNEHDSLPSSQQQLDLVASRGESTATIEVGPSLTTQAIRQSQNNLPSSTQSFSSAQTTASVAHSQVATTATTTIAAAASSAATATTVPAHRIQPVGVSDLSPTYELSPVAVAIEEAKVTSNQVRTYSTARPTHEHVYEQHGGKHDSNGDIHESSSTTDAIVSQEQPQQPTHPDDAYFRPQLTQTTSTNYQDQRRPMIDYSALPTIIVSKRLESQSTSRISQPPPPIGNDDNKATVSQQTLATSSATTRAPQNSGTTFPYHEMTTTSNTPQSQSHAAAGAHYPPLVPAASSDQIVLDQSLDYPLTDFSSDGAGVDRVSFDRVVSGIVASPDFSKSHPPVPEIVIAQRNQPVRSSQKDGNIQTTRPDGQSLSSTTVAAPVNSQLPINKRESSKTLSPKNFGTQEEQGGHQQQQPPQVDNGDQSSLGSLLGPNALNMTSLFERGSLNESSRIASECLDCICDASSNCDATVQCISKQREKNRCGLYMISWNQYKESDISLTTLLSPQTASSSAAPSSQSGGGGGGDDSDEKLYYECTTDKNCAEKLIHLYIEKYQKDCNLDGKIDCYDIAAIHRVGPDSCNSHKFLGSQYWRDFNHCYATDRLTTTLQPQLQSSQGG